LGYRFALLVTDALILLIANHFGWNLSYGVMAALMIVGIVATIIAMEPHRSPSDARAGAATAPLTTIRGMVDAVVSPFSEFFRAHGVLALLMLAMISFYQLPEYISGPMYNPYYHDLGLSKDVVGSVRASIGSIATVLGIAAGGFAAVRFGYLWTLIAGVIIKMVAIANFAALVWFGPDVR